MERDVQLRESPWFRHGDANSWLTSSVFELKEPRSVDAEEAMTQALELFRRPTRASSEEIARVDARLRRALSDTDRFWVRWSAFVQSQEKPA